MTDNMETELFRRAVERATKEPFLLAHLLDVQGATLGGHWLDAAAKLGCTTESAVRLALCRRPDSTKADFAEQIRQIAAYAGIDADALAQFIREAEAIQSLRQTRPHSGTTNEIEGLLLAALDRLDRGTPKTAKEPGEK